MAKGFEEGVEPVAKAIRAVLRHRNMTVAEVQRAAGWKSTDLYRYLKGERGLQVVHLVKIAKAIGYDGPGKLFEEIGLALRQGGLENAPEGPRNDPSNPEALIPVSELRAVVQAFQAQIQALERSRVTVPPKIVEDLGKHADEEEDDDSTPPEQGGSGSRGRSRRPRGGNGRKP